MASGAPVAPMQREGVGGGHSEQDCTTSPRRRSIDMSKVKEYLSVAIHAYKCKDNGCIKKEGRCPGMKLKLEKLKVHWESCGNARNCKLCRAYRYLSCPALSPLPSSFLTACQFFPAGISNVQPFVPHEPELIPHVYKLVRASLKMTALGSTST